MLNRSKIAGFSGTALAFAAVLAGCGGGSSGGSGANPANSVGLTASNGLFTFASGAPADANGIRAITGLNPGDTLVGFDIRPADGLLYALGNQGRLYRVNVTTAVATPIGAQFAVALAGTSFGFDFNPMVDRIRIVSNTGQNLRVNPDTGAVVDSDPGTAGLQIDGSLAYAAGDSGFGQVPNIVAVAYANNVAGAASTTLFGIDATRGVLVSIVANAGTLTTIGSLGINPDGNTGFDIQGTASNGFAVVALGGQSRIFNINLASGAATNVGSIGNLGAVGVIGVTALP